MEKNTKTENEQLKQVQSVMEDDPGKFIDMNQADYTTSMKAITGCTDKVARAGYDLLGDGIADMKIAMTRENTMI